MTRARQKNGLLSLCMIARDSAATIGAALESVAAWVDEIVVVDTGSADATAAIAESLGARVSHFPWCDDFAAARNKSLEQARGEWIFWIDTDDTVPERTGQALRQLVAEQATPRTLGFILQVECPGRPNDPTDRTLVDHVKVFRNHPEIRFEGRIHEQVLPSIRRLGGEVQWTDLRVVHSGVDHSPEGKLRKLDRDLRILKLDAEERPEHPFVLFNLGMTLLHAGQGEEARQALDKCVALAHTGESHLRKAYALLADTLLSLGEVDQARRVCWEGLGRYPNDPELSFKLGRIEIRRKDWELAIEALRRVQQYGNTRYFASIDPGILGYKTQANLAVALEASGQLEEAFEAWLACGREEPRFEDAWDGLLRLATLVGRLDELEAFAVEMPNGEGTAAIASVLQGHIEHCRNNPDAASQYFQRALAADPESRLAQNQFARFLHERQEWELSLPLLKTMCDTDPDDPAVLFNTAHAMFRLGRHDEAIKLAEASLALRPNHDATLRLLSEAKAVQA